MSQYTGKLDSEVFLGNIYGDQTPERLASLKTLRLGTVALDIDGKKLPERYRPMFVGCAELDAYERIMNPEGRR